VLATGHFTFLGCHRPSDLKLPTFHSLHDGWLPAEDRQDEVAAGLEHFQLGRRRLLGAGMGAALDAAGQRVAAAVTLLVLLVVPAMWAAITRRTPQRSGATTARPFPINRTRFCLRTVHASTGAGGTQPSKGEQRRPTIAILWSHYQMGKITLHLLGR